MSDKHLCDNGTITAAKIQELLEGRNEKTTDFNCGRCSKSFTTLCVLHVHLMIHCQGGSFFFDHETNTAHPRHETVCSFTQVESDLLDIELGKNILESGNVLVPFSREINLPVNLPRKDTEDNNADNTNTVLAFKGAPMVVADTRIEDNFETASTREINLPRKDTEDNNEDNINTVLDFKGASVVVADTIIQDNLETHQENKGKSHTGKLNTKDQVDSHDAAGEISGSDTGKLINKDQTDGHPNAAVEISDGYLTCHETCLVNIRNVQQTQDGTISFEIDEENADLFEVTASAILERIRTEGLDWIGQDEIQMKVPGKKGVVKKVERNNSAQIVGKNENNGVNENKDRMKMIENLTLDKGKSEIKKSKSKRRQKSTIGNEFKDEMLEECIDIVLNAKDKSNFRKENFDAKEIKNDGGEMDLVSSQRRSSRKRTVSSRLKDAIWDSPLKPKYHKPLSEDYKKYQKIIKEDCTEKEYEIQERNTEIKNTQVNTGKITLTQYDEQEAEHSEPTKDNTNVIDVNNENTCQADISASEVLLSLSKGNNPQKENKESTDDERQESQVTRTPICKRGRKSRSSKYNKPDTDESDDDFSDEDKQNKTRKSNIPAHKRKDYECPTCGKLGSLATMKYHEQCHSKEKLFTCEVCGKGYKTRPCLVAHKRQHGEWKFKCDQCPAKFYRKQYLTSHLLTHTGELPHVCTQCNKGFREAYILQRHINNVHKDIRNYPCDLCDRMFFRPETRDNHRVRHFEPTLRCSYCMKMFKAELDRRKHELTHTGEKQFFCPKCSGGFTQLWPYYRHMWKKHNIGKEEAKKIRIKNKDIVSMRNINRKDPETEVTSQNENCQPVQIFIENVEDEENTEEQSQVPVNLLYGTKFIPDLVVGTAAEFKQEQITLQNDEQVIQSNADYVCQSNEGFVSQSNEELMTQSGEDVVIQPTSNTSQGTVDLKGMYDHYYIPEGSNIVLTGKLEEGTVMMERRPENPDSEISIVQQNVVILSEYPAIEETYSEIEGYTKEYSSLEI